MPAKRDPNQPGTCDNPKNFIDAFVALNPDNGVVKWANKVQSYDAWNVACIRGDPKNCPQPAGPDYDFGQGPMLFSAAVGGRTQAVLAAGQKSGIFWAVNPDSGNVLWATTGGPGGTLGGMEWGSATDGQRIYFAIANNSHQSYTLKDGTTTNGGSWGALDPATGEILWQTADPNSDPNGVRAIDVGAVSVANGVVYAGSMGTNPGAATQPTMFALDAATGAIKWQFVSGGSVASGAAIADGKVFWGSGYARAGGLPNNKFYAFGLP